MTNKTPDEHSEMIGGSSARRVINCPGSWSLGKTVPRKPSSSFADEGTLLHDGMAMLLSKQFKRPTEMIGLKYKGHTITEALFDELVIPALEAFNAVPWIDYMVETRVEYPAMPGEFGTADIIGITEDATYVWDWKFGRGKYVSPLDNEQLKYYGRGAMFSRPDWFSKKKPVRLAICQPAFKANQLYDEVSVQDLLDFEKELLRTTRVMQKPDAPFSAGDWCQWCPAEDVCPVKTQMAMAALDKDGELPPEELGRWLKEDAPRLEEMIKSRRALAKAQLEAGHKVPGMKLVKGKLGNRAWGLSERVIGQRLRALPRPFNTVGDYYTMKLNSPTAVEKMLKKKGKAITILGKEDDLVVRKAASVNLVSDDAQGEAILAPREAFKKFAAKVNRRKPS